MKAMKGLILTLAVIFVAAIACAGGAGDHGHGDDNGKANGKANGSNHMKHMEQVRNLLKKELGDKYDAPVPPATAQQLKQGEEVFQKTCAACHGSGGKGDGPAAAALNPKPANFTDPEHSKFYSDQGRIHIIKKGIKGTPMIGWENTLKEEEIISVYMYVRSLRASGDDEPGHH